MKIIKGKYKGSEATLHQFANDWISANVGNVPVILSPASVWLTNAEAERMESAPREHSGTFWREWALVASDGGWRLRRPA